MNLVDAQTLNALSESSIFPIIEFASVAVIIFCTYLGTHYLLGHLKPATKMLVSMFLGTCAYTIGKLVLIALVIDPFTNNPLQL